MQFIINYYNDIIIFYTTIPTGFLVKEGSSLQLSC